MVVVYMLLAVCMIHNFKQRNVIRSGITTLENILTELTSGSSSDISELVSRARSLEVERSACSTPQKVGRGGYGNLLESPSSGTG
jgi:hypothetical protein